MWLVVSVLVFVPDTIEVKRMIGDLDVENFFYGLFDRLDTGVTEFHNFPGIGKNYVVVLPVEIGFFILGLILAKLVFSHKFAFQQQFDGIVKCRPAHSVIFVFHIDIERFYIKMLITFIDLLQDGVALGGLPVPVFFQESRKNVFYNFLILITHVDVQSIAPQRYC